MEQSLGKLINLIHCITRLINQREMVYFAKEYLVPQRVEYVLAETTDPLIMRKNPPIFANNAKLNLLILGYEGIEWGISNWHVQ